MIEVYFVCLLFSIVQLLPILYACYGECLHLANMHILLLLFSSILNVKWDILQLTLNTNFS